MAYEIANKDDPTQWRSIADLLPQRDFTDLTDQVPGEHEQEEPDLPDQPDPDQALLPLRRAGFKQRVPSSGMVPAAVRRRLQELEDTGEYEPSIPDEPAPPDPSIEVVNDDGTGSAPSTGPPVPTEEPSSIVPLMRNAGRQITMTPISSMLPPGSWPTTTMPSGSTT